MNLLRLITARTSGIAYWTPANIATALWFDASDSATLTYDPSTQEISQWRDKSGNGHNFAQGNSARQPVYSISIQNGLNAVFFRNLAQSPSFLENTSFQYTGTALHMFSVHKSLRPSGSPGWVTNYGRLFSFSDTVNQDYLTTAGILISYKYPGTELWLYRQGSPIATTAPVPNEWTLVDAQRNGTTGTIALNGNPPITGTTASDSQNILRSRFGNDFAAIDSGLDGYIAEQIVLTTIPTSDIIAKLQGYLAHKWGIQASLPNSHPYKLGPPTQ